MRELYLNSLPTHALRDAPQKYGAVNERKDASPCLMSRQAFELDLAASTLASNLVLVLVDGRSFPARSLPLRSPGRLLLQKLLPLVSPKGAPVGKKKLLEQESLRRAKR